MKFIFNKDLLQMVLKFENREEMERFMSEMELKGSVPFFIGERKGESNHDRKT